MEGCRLWRRRGAAGSLSLRTCPVFLVRLLEGWPGLCCSPQPAPGRSALESDAGVPLLTFAKS